MRKVVTVKLFQRNLTRSQQLNFVELQNERLLTDLSISGWIDVNFYEDIRDKE